MKVDIKGALKGLSEAQLKMRAAAGIYAETAGKKLESTAKKDASWKDRSGQARETIEGGKVWRGDKCEIYLSGNKEYSPCLEFANEKKYAVLYPTVEKLSPEILKGMRNLFK